MGIVLAVGGAGSVWAQAPDGIDLVGTVVFWLVVAGLVGVAGLFGWEPKNRTLSESERRSGAYAPKRKDTPTTEGQRLVVGMIGIVVLVLGLLLGKWWLGL